MTEEEFDRKVRELERETTLCVIFAVAMDAAAVAFLLIVEFWQ